VATHGRMESLLKGRIPVDVSEVKTFILDEADLFFTEEKNFKMLKTIVFCDQLKDRPEGKAI